MARRRLEKRLMQGFLGIGVLYVLASVVAPGELPTVEHEVSVAALPSPLQWRPAALVLARKPEAGLGPSRLWTSDSAGAVEPRALLTRWHRIFVYATRYNISADLAGKIFDVATSEGIEPELAFRLVNVESEFKTRASSNVGAVGLTQLMLGTAREFQPNITRKELMDPETNLHIGFRYLRGLIREQKGNLQIALLVYNRGPVAVQAALSQGLNPTNGYERTVTKGYRGRGTLD
jgi:soluble lytic murein transglycosylase-like protein